LESMESCGFSLIWIEVVATNWLKGVEVCGFRVH
jgi:hypothetical protein